MTEERPDGHVIALRLNGQQRAFVERAQLAHYPGLTLAEMVRLALKETAEVMPKPPAGGPGNG